MILYQGLLSSPASWARVGRGYLSELLRQGIEVQAISPRGFLYDSDFEIPDGVEIVDVRSAHANRSPEIGLGFLHPPHLDRLLGERRLNFFVWESDRVPREWIPHLETVDRVIVPSEFTRQALVSSGLPASCVAIAPYGFDPETTSRARAVRRERSPAEPFTFLAVAAPHHRKGVRELLLAYGQAFSGNDPVRLLVKTTYDPGTKRRKERFEIAGWDSLCEECGLQRNGAPRDGAPRVELTMDTRSDGDMADLYGQSDVFVAPTWGESFGLAILDALASGLPAVVTDWGGQCEFSPQTDDRLPYHLEEGADRLYTAAEGAQVAIPDRTYLAHRLWWHAENRDASRALGEHAEEHVRHLTWGSATQRLLGVIGDVRP